MIELLIILAPLLWELVSDWYRIEINGKDDTHDLDVIIRIVLCVGVGWLTHTFFDTKTITQGAVFAGLLFAVFSPVLNIMRGKSWRHRGKEFFDKIWETYTTPLSEIFFRLWFVYLGVEIYYNYEKTFLNFISWIP